MYMKKLAVACTFAFGTITAGGAQATTHMFAPVQVDLFLSGASAVENNLKAQLSNLFVGSYQTACDNTSTNCAHFFAVTGTFRTAAPVPISLWGKTGRITYRYLYSSARGVNPVAREEQIQWMKVEGQDPVLNSLATCSSTPPLGASSTLANFFCSPTGDDSGNNGRKPDLGISEVEPKMYQAPLNVEFGKTQLSPGDLSSLSWMPVYQQAFGVPVTDVIPTSLLLTEAMVLSMVANVGSMHDWAAVPNAPLAAINPGQNTNKPVVVCRHVDGGQAMANYYFNNFGCASPYSAPSSMTASAGFGAQGSGATKNDPIIVDPTVGYTVVENPSSGDVRSCLTAAQNGTNWTFKGDTGLWYQVTFSGLGRDTLNNIIYTNVDTTVVAPYGAVGILSYDSAGQESGWHFHDLNDFLTTHGPAITTSGRPATSTAKYALAAMMESPWNYFSEVTMQYRNGANGKTALSNIPPLVIPATGNYSVGDLKTLADSLIDILRDPTKVNANLGNAALPIYYPASMNSATNKVSKGSKFGNTCNVKLLLYKPVFW